MPANGDARCSGDGVGGAGRAWCAGDGRREGGVDGAAPDAASDAYSDARAAAPSSGGSASPASPRRARSFAGLKKSQSIALAMGDRRGGGGGGENMGASV